MTRRGPGISLRTRVFLVNAAVFLAAGIGLALTPATISVPTDLREATLLGAGLTVTVLVNLFVLRRTFNPLSRLTEAMERFEPLSAGGRVPVYGNDREIVQLTTAFNDMLGRIEQERRESVRLSLAAQEGERRRVAQELHDEIGQSLTALLLQIEGLTRSDPAVAREDLSELTQATRETLTQVREVARRLRPGVLDDLGLEQALDALCQRLETTGRIPIRCQIQPDLPRLQPEAELVTYRIAQEALTNTFRHAQASQIDLRLVYEEDDVVLTVADDGRGLEDAEPGAGIQGMRERALLLGAGFGLSSDDGSGTTVWLRLDGQRWVDRSPVPERLESDDESSRS